MSAPTAPSAASATPTSLPSSEAPQQPTAATAAAPAATATLHPNPKVAELQAIFPTVDVAVVELVLETCGGSTDRAIEQLLGMTDENFRPDELEGTREDSQVDLDEEFARSLQLQDEKEYRQQQQQQQQRQQTGGGGGGFIPYQPRVRRVRPPAPAPAHDQQGDAFYQPQSQAQTGAGAGAGGGYEAGDINPPGMLALEDKLEKYAEAGKQTFNSLLSRAKAKYSEYQANQASRNGTPTAQGQGQGQGYGEASRYAPGGSRGGEQGRGLWGDMNVHSPSVRSESISSQSTLDPPYSTQTPTQSQPIRTSSQRWQPTDTYDDPLPHRGGMTSPNRIDVVGRSPVGAGAGAGGRGSPRLGSVSPEKGKIDPAKLGILPKKRVDLLSTSPQTPTNQIPTKSLSSTTATTAGEAEEEEDFNPSLPNAPASLVAKIPPTPPADERYRLEDSDDELDYTKNPFDEK